MISVNKYTYCNICDLVNKMKECDLVMKGGITSGIVYPKAIFEIHREYKLKQIGGTSAGAIAAALAGAAEYAREEGGFKRLNELPNEFNNGLKTFFQPYKIHKKLFNKALEIKDTDKKQRGKWWWTKTIAWGVFNIFSVSKSLRSLDKTHFGMCPGTNTKARKDDLINWLNYQLENIAFRADSNKKKLIQPDHRPLTFGDLKEKDITLRLVTTNLSKGVPISLPFLLGDHLLKEDDLGWLVPENIRKWLVNNHKSDRDGFVKIPTGDDMPIILALRMSLSFPVLFSAIPVYTEDNSLRTELKNNQSKIKPLVVNYFSDGGISSNFPIHYFDSVLPTRPTFGISLSKYDSRKQIEDMDQPGWNRIYMPSKANQGLQYAITKIEKTGAFFSSILNSARNWQDSVQMKLPGYRERIVHVALTNKEGGLNLNMSPEEIQNLVDLGSLAGKRVLNKHPDEKNQDKFSFEDHRWRRILSTSNALEELLQNFSASLMKSNPSGDPELLSILEYLRTLKAEDSASYKQPSKSELENLVARLTELNKAAKFWSENPQSDSWKIPKPESTFRNLAKWLTQ